MAATGESAGVGEGRERVRTTDPKGFIPAGHRGCPRSSSCSFGLPQLWYFCVYFWSGLCFRGLLPSQPLLLVSLVWSVLTYQPVRLPFSHQCSSPLHWSLLIPVFFLPLQLHRAGESHMSFNLLMLCLNSSGEKFWTWVNRKAWCLKLWLPLKILVVRPLCLIENMWYPLDPLEYFIHIPISTSMYQYIYIYYIHLDILWSRILEVFWRLEKCKLKNVQKSSNLFKIFRK